ncbi:MAG: alpha-amylase family glycosyl hydrolase [Chloroflexota bacterium]
MTTPAGQPTHPWWAGAVIYQVYPRSFADANGDGVGDLPGIISRLDHLAGTDASLGVDAVWLSPIFPSPLADYGYDIADFTGVAPEYGTLADLDALVAALHARGARLLLDLVPCHTSVAHPWFVESRSSRSNARRDWYTWADAGADGGPPNNWRAAFGGSAWELDPGSGQYYLHSFYPEQPDLNWRDPAVARAIGDVLRFWFQRGVDGFRVDAITHAMKDPLLRDNPPAGPRTPPFPRDRTGQDHVWDDDRPEMAEVVGFLRKVADEYVERLLLAEAYLPVERLARYYGDGGDNGFERMFDFELSLIEWGAEPFRRTIERAERFTPPGLEPTWAFSNHDLSRHATRFGEARARLAALLLLSLRGTICLYAGEEIGMVDAPSLPGAPHDRFGRDVARTPMQWDASPGGGFSAGTPWLPLIDPEARNVAAQMEDPGSLLNLYRRLLALRRGSPAMRHGALTLIPDLPDDALAWTRTVAGEQLLMLANMSDRRLPVDASSVAAQGEVVVATGRRVGLLQLGDVVLGAREGLVLRV